MAESNSHKLGQIIGETLELAIEPHLIAFAQQHGLFLDRKGVRPCRPTKKVTWTDINGSTHDLDFVLERDGSPKKFGTPLAFIETAWRRYTKHSRAKAQEIQGALEPLAQKYRQISPFKGVIIAGVFTKGAVSQLRGLGFQVVHFTYDEVVAAFASQGANVAYDEDTPEKELGRKVSRCVRLTNRQLRLIGAALSKAKARELADFLAGLSAVVRRKVTRVRLLALYGTQLEFATVGEALVGLDRISEDRSLVPFCRYEVRIEFGNGDRVEGEFDSKSAAATFLKLAET